MTEKELVKRSDFLTNSAYVIALALDLIVRESEKTLVKLTPPQGWKLEKKQMFTRFTDYVKNACLMNEKITQDIYDLEEKNCSFKYTQVWQEEANELARFILMVMDRLTDVDTINKIHTFIREQPSNGIATEELLQKFYLKKYDKRI